MIPTLEITDDRMTSTAHDTVATRVSADPERWIVSGHHGVYSRDQAVTAMSIAQLRAHKLPGANDTIMIDMFEQELLVPALPIDPWALLKTFREAAQAVRQQIADPQPGRNRPQEGEYLRRIGEVFNELAPALEPLIATAGEQVIPESHDDPWLDAKAQGVRVKDVLGWVGDALRKIGWTSMYASDVNRARGDKHWGPIELESGETVYGWTCDPHRHPDLHAQLMREQGFTSSETHPTPDPQHT